MTKFNYTPKVKVTLHGNCMPPTDAEIDAESVHFKPQLCHSCTHARMRPYSQDVATCGKPPKGLDKVCAMIQATLNERCRNYTPLDKPRNNDTRKNRIKVGLQFAESLKGKRLPPAPENPVKSL